MVPGNEDTRDYLMVLKGEAGPTVQAAFPELEVTVGHGKTVFRGEFADQAALHGVLHRIQDLGIEILEVRMASDDRG